MIRRKIKIKLGIISGPFFLLVLAVSFAWASNDNLYTMVRLFDRIAVTVSDRYVDDIDPDKLINTGINAIMENLDPYSRYLRDQDYFYLLQETQGEYSGIGIELENHADTLRVGSVIKGSPASRANIRMGDRILKLDTIDVIGKSRIDCRKLLRGDNGTALTISLWRPLLRKKLELDVIRDEIHIEPIPYWGVDMNNNGYIQIARFSEGSMYEVKSIISLLLARGVNGIILDLRDNPGGLLYEAVETAALFLNSSDGIVETRGRGSSNVKTYTAREDGIYNNGHLVVIINNQTASAAEILAGAIQDNDRGLIVGSSSYGKGLVQQILQFSDNSALKLTTAKYYTPSERCIQKDNIESELVKKESSDPQVIYYTKSGRPVFGGGGIIPDIYVEPINHPPVIDEIITRGYFFDYVTEKSDDLTIDNTFIINDKIIDDFIAYINDRNYVYYSPAYDLFNQFVSQNNDLRETSRVIPHIEAIEEILKERSCDEILSMKSSFKELLYEYFITINLGEKESFELIYQKRDPELVKASVVLKNPETYGSLLVGY